MTNALIRCNLFLDLRITHRTKLIAVKEVCGFIVNLKPFKPLHKRVYHKLVQLSHLCDRRKKMRKYLEFMSISTCILNSRKTELGLLKYRMIHQLYKKWESRMIDDKFSAHRPLSYWFSITMDIIIMKIIFLCPTVQTDLFSSSFWLNGKVEAWLLSLSLGKY